MTKILLRKGIKKILVEKPGALNADELRSVHEAAQQRQATVYVAYNRRCYASTLKAQEIIREDGGIRSFHFEFTEWSHEIAEMVKAPGIKAHWLLANSSHVIDLAFFLGGRPREIRCHVGGKLDWHPSSSIFTGSGISESGALFSYHADWGAPGRWGLEVLTARNRLLFRPMEKLQIIRQGSLIIEDVEINDTKDRDYKPGLYEQVKRFLCGEYNGLCNLDDQVSMWPYYCKIAGYWTDMKKSVNHNLENIYLERDLS